MEENSSAVAESEGQGTTALAPETPRVAGRRALSGPWIFEPHGMFGRKPIEGEGEWPLGYISSADQYMPIFALEVVLEYDADDLRDAALKMAAASDLLQALKDAPCPSSMGTAQEHYSRFYDWLNGPAKAAIAKAEGRGQ